jgi:two-component system, chemotaxis family, chemotaxis protein CheY
LLYIQNAELVYSSTKSFPGLSIKKKRECGMMSSLNEKIRQADLPIGIKQGGIPYTVFIIDDSTTAREFLKRIFLSLQFIISGEAVNGEIAITMLKSESIKPDFIFIDLVMPQMDGIETIKQIKPLLTKSKIIMVTSHTERHIVEDLINLNVDGYIKKPYDRDTVVKKMAALTGRELREE